MSNPEDLSPKEYAQALELLKKIDFLADVPDDDLKSVLFALQKESYGKNVVILFQGEIANRLFIVRQGKVIISTKNKGTKIILAELTPPMYFGEISLLRPTAATATVTTGDEGADVLLLTHDAFYKLLTRKIPDIAQRVQRIIEQRLADKKKAKDADDLS